MVSDTEIECPNCGHRISFDVTTCPNCCSHLQFHDMDDLEAVANGRSLPEPEKACVPAAEVKSEPAPGPVPAPKRSFFGKLLGKERK